MQLDSETIEKLRKRCKESLFFLAMGILGFKDLTKEIHRPICVALQNYEKNTRLMIIFPRTWFKSTLASIAYPIWRAIRNPNVRGLVVQNSFSNACKKLAAIRTIFEKNLIFRALFPEILPNSTCRWMKECLEVNRTEGHPEGTFEAAGTGTSATSRHYDFILQDDTVSPKRDDMTGIVQQPTQADIEKAIGWHNLCHPMLLHPTESQIVIIGTRWAERDLIGYVLENSPGYKVLSRAACENAAGEPATLQEGGHIVWDRFNEPVLKELEKAEGPYMFASLYLNKPTAAVNQVFKREWIKYHSNRPSDCVFCTSVDLASAKKEESSDPDYNIVTSTGISERTGRVYVADYFRERCSPGALIDAVFSHYNIFKPLVIFIEAIGYQRTLVYWLKKKQDKLGVYLPIREIVSLRGSKNERIRRLEPYFSNGLVSLREGMSALERELLAFPKGAHDDILDTLSMQAPFWNEILHDIKQEEDRKLRADPMSGACIISELRNRFEDVNRYPYDIGNMRDAYIEEVAMRRPDIAERIRDRAEEVLASAELDSQTEHWLHRGIM